MRRDNYRSWSDENWFRDAVRSYAESGDKRGEEPDPDDDEYCRPNGRDTFLHPYRDKSENCDSLITKRDKKTRRNKGKTYPCRKCDCSGPKHFHYR